MLGAAYSPLRLMKKILFLLLGSCLFVSAALAGGPDIEMLNAHIDDVVITENGTMVFRVTGTVKLFVEKTVGENPDMGNAKWVTVVMKSGELRCFREIFPFDKIERRDDRNEAFRKLKGTYQHLQMWGTSAIVENYMVTHVTATALGIWPPSKQDIEFADSPSDEAKPPTPPSSPRTP